MGPGPPPPRSRHQRKRKHYRKGAFLQTTTLKVTSGAKDTKSIDGITTLCSDVLLCHMWPRMSSSESSLSPFRQPPRFL
eukprot:scaffold285222_cov32-Tisochrysis_lutea.AAC.1